MTRFAGGAHSSSPETSGEERTPSGSFVWCSDSVDGRWVELLSFPPNSSVIATAAIIVILSWTGFRHVRISLLAGIAITGASARSSDAHGSVSGRFSIGIVAIMGRLSLDGEPFLSVS